jgi:GT2 family glycosyltransferase
VVVCTYNSAPTLPECLDSLLALSYPNREIIVVNDGSRDGTPEILERYPVQAIHVANGGLSRARNRGAEAAAGDIVAYTDADVRVDPDWLTYLVAKLHEPGFIAAGGPNRVPPEDGPIAQAVGAAVGGPNEVLLHDGEAEHVPGCNMAFWRRALNEIGGFDARFTAAGDDVDVCWRLMELGYKIGFHPAAVVWHHRRASIQAYLKQQRGYGSAEADLERKYPEKFNLFGYIYWRGAIYGAGQTLPFARPRIYGGEFGSALFQSVYNPGPQPLFYTPIMFEWYVMALGLLLAGGFSALMRWAGGMACVAVGSAALAATVGLCGLIASAGIRSHPMPAAAAMGHAPEPAAARRPRLGPAASGEDPGRGDAGATAPLLERPVRPGGRAAEDGGAAAAGWLPDRSRRRLAAMGLSLPARWLGDGQGDHRAAVRQCLEVALGDRAHPAYGDHPGRHLGAGCAGGARAVGVRPARAAVGNAPPRGPRAGSALEGAAPVCGPGRPEQRHGSDGASGPAPHPVSCPGSGRSGAGSP